MIQATTSLQDDAAPSSTTSPITGLTPNQYDQLVALLNDKKNHAANFANKITQIAHIYPNWISDKCVLDHITSCSSVLLNKHKCNLHHLYTSKMVLVYLFKHVVMFLCLIILHLTTMFPSSHITCCPFLS